MAIKPGAILSVEVPEPLVVLLPVQPLLALFLVPPMVLWYLVLVLP